MLHRVKAWVGIVGMVVLSACAASTEDPEPAPATDGGVCPDGYEPQDTFKGCGQYTVSCIAPSKGRPQCCKC